MHTYQSMISALLGEDKAHIDAYFSCYQEPLGKSIKVIEQKINSDVCSSIGKEYGRTLEKQPFTDNTDVLYITREDNTNGLGKHWLHTLGFFYIQEVAASLPAQFIPIRQGDIVLDMCAAPGGKSVQIADKGGFVVSNEVSGSRIIPLQYNLNRTGTYTSCVTSIQGGQRGNSLPEFFDHVLVDAPCSGEGTGFKSDDGIKWWQEDNILKIARLQKELLSSAIKSCKPGGTIVYSTCTINPRENEGVISFALEKYKDVVVLENVDIQGKSLGITEREGDTVLSTENASKVARFWPQIQHTGGFFIAKFTKVTSTGNTIEHKKNTTQSQLDISPGLQKRVAELLYTDFGITIDPTKHFFVGSQKKIYLTHPLYLHIHNELYIEKTGIPIYKINNNTERSPLHGLGLCLGQYATKCTYDIDTKDIQKYSEGFDILATKNTITTKNKYVILQRNGYGVSVGKIVDGYIKNKCIK